MGRHRGSAKVNNEILTQVVLANFDVTNLPHVSLVLWVSGDVINFFLVGVEITHSSPEGTFVRSGTGKRTGSSLGGSHCDQLSLETLSPLADFLFVFLDGLSV